MGFFIGLLLVFTFFMYLPKLLVWYMRRKARRDMGRAFDQMFGGGATAGAGNRPPRREPSPNGKPRKKVFTQEDGEYVDFEEVETTMTYTEETYTGTIETEQQVSDAEWEEIK